MLRIDEIKLPVAYSQGDLLAAIAKRLRLKPDKISNLKVVRKSIDGRKRDKLCYVLGVEVAVAGNEDKILKPLKDKKISKVVKIVYRLPQNSYGGNERPIVVGAGPGGLFCGLLLAEAGLKPLIIEGGKNVEERQKDVDAFWQKGILCPEDNVQFGEGGAGAFSDGKLTTGTKNLHHLHILEEFVKAGAPEEILYLAKPHIGSDNLPIVVANLRRKIQDLGGEFRFSTLLKDIIIENQAIKEVKIADGQGESILPCDCLILATGHSSRDTYEMLYQRGVTLQAKAFSLGVRIEHSQKMINAVQYGTDELGAADYKLAVHLPNGRSAYTFCMCPGGLVVGAASESGGVVTNGMSSFARDGVNANSGLLIGVTPADFPDNHPLAGMYWQRQIEQQAFMVGGSDYSAPCQRVEDFLAERPSTKWGQVVPTYCPAVKMGDIGSCLPDIIRESLALALPLMGSKLKGFDDPNGILTAPETRSSAPIRILRDETGETNIRGIFPLGEGAGYAGGIMSSAADGLKIGEFVLNFKK